MKWLLENFNRLESRTQNFLTSRRTLIDLRHVHWALTLEGVETIQAKVRI
jgi:hypothetical protein